MDEFVLIKKTSLIHLQRAICCEPQTSPDETLRLAASLVISQGHLINAFQNKRPNDKNEPSTMGTIPTKNNLRSEDGRLNTSASKSGLPSPKGTFNAKEQRSGGFLSANQEARAGRDKGTPGWETFPECKRYKPSIFATVATKNNLGSEVGRLNTSASKSGLPSPKGTFNAKEQRSGGFLSANQEARAGRDKDNNLPFFCDRCGIFGHSTSMCLFKAEPPL